MLTTVEVHSDSPNVPQLDLPILGNTGLGPFHISKIDGLGPVKAEVNSKGYGELDGEFYTGSHVPKRNIVMTIGLNPGAGFESVGAMRKVLYAYLMPKLFVTLKFVSVDRDLVGIKGYVEACEPNLFAKAPEVQVSIICPKPYFISNAVKTVTGTARNKPGTKGFIYNGDITNGLVLQLHQGDTPYIGRVVVSMGVFGPLLRRFEAKATLTPMRYFQLNSGQGVKKVESAREGTGAFMYNLLRTMTDDSLWPYVVPGTNRIRVFTTSVTPQPWSLHFYERYGGL